VGGLGLVVFELSVLGLRELELELRLGEGKEWEKDWG
jgi:hypothetical protein